MSTCGTPPALRLGAIIESASIHGSRRCARGSDNGMPVGDLQGIQPSLPFRSSTRLPERLDPSTLQQTPQLAHKSASKAASGRHTPKSEAKPASTVKASPKASPAPVEKPTTRRSTRTPR